MTERRRSVLWSPEALTDLDGIWDYYAGVAGSDAADSMLRDIGKMAAVIEDHPFAGRSRDEIRAGLRHLRPALTWFSIGSLVLWANGGSILGKLVGG